MVRFFRLIGWLVIILTFGVIILVLLTGDTYRSNTLSEGLNGAERRLNEIIDEAEGKICETGDFFLFSTDDEGEMSLLKVNDKAERQLTDNIREQIEDLIEDGQQSVLMKAGNAEIEAGWQILSLEKLRCRTEYKQEAENHNRYAVYCSVVVMVEVRGPFVRETAALDMDVLIEEIMLIEPCS